MLEMRKMKREKLHDLDKNELLKKQKGRDIKSEVSKPNKHNYIYNMLSSLGDIFQYTEWHTKREILQ